MVVFLGLTSKTSRREVPHLPTFHDDPAALVPWGNCCTASARSPSACATSGFSTVPSGWWTPTTPKVAWECGAPWGAREPMSWAYSNDSFSGAKDESRQTTSNNIKQLSCQKEGFHASGNTTTQQLQLLQATGWQRLFVLDSCLVGTDFLRIDWLSAKLTHGQRMMRRWRQLTCYSKPAASYSSQTHGQGFRMMSPSTCRKINTNERARFTCWNIIKLTYGVFDYPSRAWTCAIHFQAGLTAISCLISVETTKRSQFFVAAEIFRLTIPRCCLVCRCLRTGPMCPWQRRFFLRERFQLYSMYATSSASCVCNCYIYIYMILYYMTCCCFFNYNIYIYIYVL